MLRIKSAFVFDEIKNALYLFALSHFLRLTGFHLIEKCSRCCASSGMTGAALIAL